MNEELQKYIEALKRNAGNARYVQLKLSDGSLTSPMSIEDAAAYLYSGNKPQTKILPSEQVANRQDRQWSAREAARQAELARSRAIEYNTRSFYRDVALPTATLGLSKFIPGLEGQSNEEDMKYAIAGAVSRNPVLSRIFWPAATAAAVWSWYANTHKPDFRFRTESPEQDYDAGLDAPLPTDQTPPVTSTDASSTQPVSPETSQDADDTVSQSEEQESSPSPQPEQNNEEDPNKKPKKRSKTREKVSSEAKKVGKNIAKGYGKVAKGAAYGMGFVGVPAGVAYGIYKATQPKPTEADEALAAQIKQIEELQKLKQVQRNKERIDSMLNLLEGSINTKAQPDSLPSGFKPIVGYNEKDPNQVVTYSSSGDPDSVVTLQKEPDISRFKKK